MKVRNAASRAFLLIIALLAALVAAPSTASAASVYDSAVQLTDTVVVATSNSSVSIDVTRNWKAHIASANGSCTSSVKSSLLDALDHGSVAVNQELNDSSTTDYRRVQVSWSESPNLTMIWSGSDSSASVTFPSVYPGPPATGGAILFMNSSGGVQVFCDVAAFGQPWSNAEGTARGLFATNYPNYPSGYGGLTIPSVPPAAKYVAMGDSFSGGEGNEPFEAGSNEGGVNQCHRSLKAYPRLLQKALALGSTAFVACGGASTTNVLSGQWNEPAQLEPLSGITEKVTLTIGGINAGFVDYLLGCAVTCGPGTPVYDAMIAGINQPAFSEVLGYTYEQILQKAPNAQLYVADYPYLSTPSVTACWGLDFSGAYEVQAALNNAIRTAVQSVDSSRIHYVSVNYNGSPFSGGELCGGSGQSLFNGLMLPGEYSLHPNVAGQQAYAEVFEDVMN